MEKFWQETNLKKKSFCKKIFGFFAVGFVLFVCFFIYIYYKNIYINSEIIVKKGDSFQKVYKSLSFWDDVWLKIYLKFSDNNSILKPWVYSFSWCISKQRFVSVLENWPQKKYEKISILEWWNKYEVDKSLSEKWIISSWEYIDIVENKDKINSYIKKYDFLKQDNVWKFDNLEWFLYPDTYKINISDTDFLSVFVSQQLDAFDKKIRRVLSWDIKNFNHYLQNQYINYSFELYDFIKLASIIEKEEKKEDNKDLVAGVFLNRLSSGMRIDADISLCYWLWETINQCKKHIWKNIRDKDNKYNTRTNIWLPPTPIGNPSYSTIKSLLNFEKTSYYYYLHDKNWKIYPSRSLSEHNFKKSKYLKQ